MGSSSLLHGLIPLMPPQTFFIHPPILQSKPFSINALFSRIHDPPVELQLVQYGWDWRASDCNLKKSWPGQWGAPQKDCHYRNSGLSRIDPTLYPHHDQSLTVGWWGGYWAWLQGYRWKGVETGSCSRASFPTSVFIDLFLPHHVAS